MWKYILVFIGAFLVDVSPFPLPPAFTVMIFLQVKYHLELWIVIAAGVTGSILGRLILTLYVPKISHLIFKPSKNEDIQFLGKKMKEKGWRSQLSIVIYSLMPLPTTPLFVAAGIAKIKPLYIIPAFFVGKLTSDTIAVITGKYAAENTADLLNGIWSWKSVTGLIAGLLLIFILLFIDWRTLILKKSFTLKFKILKSGKRKVKA
jgi:membrane protein YqaA with SNARE-associated domain